MKGKYIVLFLIFFLCSCSTKKNIVGNYYCSCYFDFYPRYVVKIKKSEFEIYSGSVACRKSIGKYDLKDSLLLLYKTHEIVNNFKDTITIKDTLKFVLKNKRLIPLKDKECFLKKTNNKNKLFQFPCVEIDTTRVK